jgi:hypothetical protein
VNFRITFADYKVTARRFLQAGHINHNNLFSFSLLRAFYNFIYYLFGFCHILSHFKNKNECKDTAKLANIKIFAFSKKIATFAISYKIKTYRIMKKLLLLITICLLATVTAFADVQINETNFPDPNFRKWLLEQSYGSKGYITDAEITNIIKIDVSIFDPMTIPSLLISDLTGIKFFINLEELYCSNNAICSLDISDLTNLRVLRFNRNLLTSLDVSDLTNLEVLNIMTNQLTSLDVSSLTNLRDLRFNNNQLTTLDVSSLTNIETLSCSSNQLTSLDLTGLNRLVAFHGINQRPELTLTKCPVYQHYALAIDLNNPTDFVDGLIYENGILTSISNLISSSPFSVTTSNPNFTLSGTLTLNYTNETNIPKIENENRQAIGFYSIMGVRLGEEPQSGMYVILYDNGSSEKVMR